MGIFKTVAFRSPYIGLTFQRLATALVGGDGYMAGAVTSDNGVTITVEPYQFIQAGVVVENDANTTGIVVPTKAEPWFLIASNASDDPSTAPVLQVQTDPSLLAAGVVLAYKVNGRWRNPISVSTKDAVAGVGAEVGVELGLQSFGALAGGFLDTVQTDRGVLVDPAGHRREIAPATTAAAVILNELPLPPHGNHPRTDWIVLRQREEASAQIQTLLGSVTSTTATAPTATWETGAGVKRPSFYAPRGAGFDEYFTAHGSGNNLRAIFTGGGVFVPLGTIFAGAATIDHVWIAGQRASDEAVVIVFAEGNAVKVGAFNQVSGIAVDAPVVIDTQSNACIRIRATIDLDDQLHVVYQHDEGGAPPNQQIYYTKRTLAVGATFGNAAVTPRLVNIINSTRNDTWPSIAVDRKRQAHVSYATGTTADEFGELRYAVIDSTGVTTSTASYSTFGGQTDPNDPAGIVAATFDNIRKPTVVVTAHDEVYVFAIGFKNGGGVPAEVVVFNPDFAARLGGFNVIQLAGLFTAAGETLNALAVMADEMGQFHVGANYSASGLLYQRLDTRIAPYGVLGDSYLETTQGVIAAGTGAVTEMHARPGACGEFVVTYLLATSSSGTFAFTRLTGRRFTPHPNDVYLSGINLDRQAGGGYTVNEDKFEVFNARPKKMSYPVLVGNEGDYQGYGALGEAVAAANRIGGHIVLRGGEHKLTSPLTLRSGVSLEGEGLAVLSSSAAAQTAAWITLGSGGALAVSSIAGQIVTFAAPVAIRNNARVGDLVVMATSGNHRIRRIIDADRIALDGVAPVGATCNVYSCGMSFENVQIDFSASLAATHVLHAKYLYQGQLRGVRLAGALSATSTGFFIEGCAESTFEALDTSAMTGGGALVGGMKFLRGRENTLRDSVFSNSNPTQLVVLAGVDEDLRLRIQNCKSGTTGTTYVFFPGRTSPIFMINCEGGVGADPAELELVHSAAGKLVRAPLGAGTLRFQDDNTVAASGPLSLTATGLGNAEFDGATPLVITQSVNERLKAAGDTVSGVLIGTGFPNFGNIGVGRFGTAFFSNIDVDTLGTIVDLVIPGGGSLQLDGVVITDVIASVLGLALGEVATPWDAFLRDTTLSRVTTLTAPATINAAGYTATGIIVPKARFRTVTGSTGFMVDPMGFPVGAPVSVSRNEWEVSDLTVGNAGVPLGWTATKVLGGATAFDYQNPVSDAQMFRAARLRVGAINEVTYVTGPLTLPIVAEANFACTFPIAVSAGVLTNFRIFAGITDTATALDPHANVAGNKSIGFVFDPSTGWVVVTRDGLTTYSTFPVNYAMAIDGVDIYKTCRIEVHGTSSIYGARTVRFLINEVLIGETTVVPSGTMQFVFNIKGMVGLVTTEGLYIGPVHGAWSWFTSAL